MMLNSMSHTAKVSRGSNHMIVSRILGLRCGSTFRPTAMTVRRWCDFNFHLTPVDNHSTKQCYQYSTQNRRVRVKSLHCQRQNNQRKKMPPKEQWRFLHYYPYHQNFLHKSYPPHVPIISQSFHIICNKNICIDIRKIQL